MTRCGRGFLVFMLLQFCVSTSSVFRALQTFEGLLFPYDMHYAEDN